MKVRLTLKAEHDLRDIADYLTERSPTAAARVEAHLRAAFQLLSAHPHAGRRYRGGTRRFTLPRYPYLVFYDLDEAAAEVIVLTIRHGRRRGY